MITNEAPARACLADFGLSTLAPNPLGGATTITAGGTPLYMAPELLDPERFGKKNSRPTKPADMYAFGMVIYEVLSGLDPFHDKKDIAVLSLIRLVVGGTRPTKPGNAEEIGFGNGTWELMKECWKPKSWKRPTIEPVLAHLRCLASRDTEAINRWRVAKHTDNEKSRGIATHARFSFLRLGRQSRLNPPPPVSSPGDTHPFHSHEIDAQPDHPDHRMILSQWQRLDSLGPKSPHFVELLGRLVDVESNRSLALGFTGDNAGIIINILGRVSPCIPP